LSKITDALPQDISGIERVRIFSVGGELFAMAATGIEDKAIKPGPVIPLPETPRHVKGVAFLDGRLLPVIDLSQRINSQNIAPDALMMIAMIGGAYFGMRIDSDEELLSSDRIAFKQVPLIAQTSWLRYMVVRGRELIPLVDFVKMLSTGTGPVAVKPVWQRYAPDSAFPDKLFKHEVEVMEFLLLGERYALPKMEVEDVIPFKSFRALPEVPPIVIGVADHKGEILPVVDLAMMFGMRSLATSGWWMMLVNNGDYRALVVTEAVFGQRRLPVDMHRKVPVHLPHNLMYGCYPDEDAVRIILNVEAISVHFEKSLIQKFMPVLSPAMRMSPTGAVYRFPEEETGPEDKVDSGEKISEAPHPLSGVVTVETVSQPRKQEESVADVAGFNEEPVVRKISTSENMGPERQEMETLSAKSLPENDQPAEAGDSEFVEWEETETPVTPIAAEHGHNDVADVTVPGKTAAQHKLNAAREMPEHSAQIQEVSERDRIEEISKARDQSMSRQSPREAFRTSAKIKQMQKASATAAADSRLAEHIRTMARPKSGETYRMSREVEQLATLSGRKINTAGKWKPRFAFGAIAAILIACLVYFSWSFYNETLPARTSSEPANIESVKALANAQVEREARVNIQQEAGDGSKQSLVLSPLGKPQTGQALAAKLSPAPLELDIPKERPTDIDIYVVQEGDTLWSISERFTGNPFNYPRIAGENRIADPDLIFPNQRIRLIK